MANYLVGDKITIEGRTYIIDYVSIDREEASVYLIPDETEEADSGTKDILIETMKKYSQVPNVPIMDKSVNTYLNPHMHVMSSVDTVGWSPLSSNSENTDERSFAESEIESAVEHVASYYEDVDYLSFKYDLDAADLAADVISRLKG